MNIELIPVLDSKDLFIQCFCWLCLFLSDRNARWEFLEEAGVCVLKVYYYE